MRQPGGIRSKITFWFFLALFFMIGCSVVTYLVVNVVEEKHLNIENVDVVLENTLEMRRMEKNYLLYHDHGSMSQWRAYLIKTRQQFNANKEVLKGEGSPAQIAKIDEILREYETIFSAFQQDRNNDALAVQLRVQGRQLTELAENLVVQQHQFIHRLLRLIRHTLLFLLPLMVLFFGAIAAILGHGIVSSLKQLENHASSIATGNFVEASFRSDNREINSLISAFNQMSRELKRRQQQLVRSEKLACLGTMLAGVAHEFNNPLSNISSSAQILAEELGEKEGEVAADLLSQINMETMRASAIVRTLLSLAREEKFHRAHYLLSPLLQEIIDLFHGQIGKDVEIRLVVDQGVMIFADKQKIQQLFINLLKNSLDALAGQGIITVMAYSSIAELKIVFSDNGPGIPPQIREKIFDPFFTTKDTGHGSGLGLFIIHDILVQHGGSISVDANNGQGVKFTIHLPVGEK